jgi:hypothetical protein
MVRASTRWTVTSCLVIRCTLLGTAAVPHASPPAGTRRNIWCRPHSGRRGLVAEDAASHGLIIRLIIQTIRQDPTGSVQIDEASDVSRPDPTRSDQIDAEHQATDLAVGGSNPARRTHASGQRPRVNTPAALSACGGVLGGSWPAQQRPAHGSTGTHRWPSSSVPCSAGCGSQRQQM